MPARSVCLVTLSLSEAGPGRFGRQASVTDICHAMSPCHATGAQLHPNQRGSNCVGSGWRNALGCGLLPMAAVCRPMGAGRGVAGRTHAHAAVPGCSTAYRGARVAGDPWPCQAPLQWGGVEGWHGCDMPGNGTGLG